MAYSPDKLAELREAGTPVFVDMTADWCVTCKANEHAVLDTDAFRDLLAKTGAVYMKGDWTDVNPTISRLPAAIPLARRAAVRGVSEATAVRAGNCRPC